jgi:hypothetical protein
LTTDDDLGLASFEEYQLDMVKNIDLQLAGFLAITGKRRDRQDLFRYVVEVSENALTANLRPFLLSRNSDSDRAEIAIDGILERAPHATIVALFEVASALSHTWERFFIQKGEQHPTSS